MNKRIHVLFAEGLVKGIDQSVGGRRSSGFLTQAAERELMRLRQIKALDEVIPWNAQDHPELKQGTAKYVKKMRQQYEQRFKKVTAR